MSLPSTEDALLTDVKDMIVAMMVDERVIEPDEAQLKRAELDALFVPDRPLAELGWDSLQFPALLVRCEDRWDIDTSNLSVFEVFLVGDVLRELFALVEAKR